jgi:hypothetical protein
MFGLFCHPFAAPPHKLRASAQDFGLEQRLSVFSVILSVSEESNPFFTHEIFQLESSFASAQDSASGH